MEDAFGQMLLDGADTETIERDDGFLDTAKFLYFAPVTQWPAVERRALRWVRGRVLDAGLGAGRVALELQRRGRSVVGIDNSPGAVEVARQRKRGRMPGQLRLRVRYRGLSGPWFGYLFASPDEMASILEGTPWQITRLLQSGSPYYVAILE
jgi:SAM-dependent methyltransferase